RASPPGRWRWPRRGRACGWPGARPGARAAACSSPPTAACSWTRPKRTRSTCSGGGPWPSWPGRTPTAAARAWPGGPTPCRRAGGVNSGWPPRGSAIPRTRHRWHHSRLRAGRDPMFKPLPVAIGLRYLRAKRRNGFISFISLASILGIAIGVTALITTLAVMSGFQREIRDRMLQMTQHATVSAHGEPLATWRQAVEAGTADPRVAAAAPYISTEALLSGKRREPAMLRGIRPEDEAKVSILGERMVEGSLGTLMPRSYNIVLGRELALWLGVRVGDSVVATTDFQATPMGAVPQLKRFTVSGIFEAGYQDFDRGLAVVNIEDLQRLLRMGDGVTGVRLQMHDMDQAYAVARDLALKLEGPYMVSDWTMENAHLFRALKLEKTMIAILLSLIIAMGAFNLVS